MLKCAPPAALSFLVLFTPFTVSGASSDISWRIANPFRLIYDAPFISDYRRIAATLKHDDPMAVLAMEYALQQQAEDSGNHRGWAKRVFEKTCWSRLKRRLWTGDERAACRNFILPQNHRIEVAGMTAGAFAGKQCRWRFGGTEIKVLPCARSWHFRAPYKEGAAGVTLSVETTGANPAQAETTVKVEDLLIVGLGDSFASGEGNPDWPTEMDPEDVYRVRFSASRRKYPIRHKAYPDGSRWTDRMCHRSLYSQQLRAALHLSFLSPHRSVAFIGLGCSGAQIGKGIFGPHDGAEKIDKNVYQGDVYKNREWPQMRVLLGMLCKDGPAGVRPENDIKKGPYSCNGNGLKRPIDYLLISIGGNDIGFARYVAYVIGTRYRLLAKIAQAGKFFKKPTDKRTEEISRVISKGYNRLREQFELPGFIRGGDGARILLNAYPSPLHDQHGVICPGDHRDGMSFFSALKYDEDKAKEVRTAVVELRRQMKTVSASGPFQWTYVDGYLHEFIGHGWCALKAGDFLKIPKRDSKGDWQPAGPTELRPYKPRQRWFRTPNDAYLFVNRLSGRTDATEPEDNVVDDSDAADLLGNALAPDQRTRRTRKGRRGGAVNGAMHPTAEGHAVIAGYLVQAMESLIKSGN